LSQRSWWTVVDGWPQAKIRDLLPDRILASHPQLQLGAQATEAPILPAPA